jgi:23S rRNA (cytidine1920-2'-O)/16S rRNA (cytidine1409-2'-O)-methyltransferase
MARKRLDAELVRRGLVTSRSAAQAAVAEGRVLVSGSVADKPQRQVDPAEPIELLGPPPKYVGRGGEKLEGALLDFGIDPSGRRCLDVGSSTGGFVDCLLQHGARSVLATDVGKGQLAWSLRENEKVTVMERTDVRALDRATIGPVDLVTADLSFISLRTVMSQIAALAGGSPVLVLCKPQFEVGRAGVKKGVVRDPALHRQALVDVIRAGKAAGLRCLGAAPSTLEGSEGNREFFVHLKGAA